MGRGWLTCAAIGGLAAALNLSPALGQCDDYDSDSVCTAVDSCPFDPENDVDSDLLCAIGCDVVSSTSSSTTTTTTTTTTTSAVTTNYGNDYHLFNGGGFCEDRPGYCQIYSSSDCVAAAVDMGLSDTTVSSVSTPVQVSGCFLSSAGALKFNLLSSSTAEADSDQAVLCVLCPSTSEHATVATTTTLPPRTTSFHGRITDTTTTPRPARDTDAATTGRPDIDTTSSRGVRTLDTTTRNSRTTSAPGRETDPTTTTTQPVRTTSFVTLPATRPQETSEATTNRAQRTTAPNGPRVSGATTTAPERETETTPKLTRRVASTDGDVTRVTTTAVVRETDDPQTRGDDSTSTATTTQRARTTSAVAPPTRRQTVQAATTRGYYSFFDGPTKCADEDGYCVISTKQECQTAASVLGLSDSTAGTVTSPLQAAGCYVSGTDLRFNQQLDSSGSVGSTGGAVCVICSTTRDTTEMVVTTASRTTAPHHLQISTTQGYYGLFYGPTKCSVQEGYCIISTQEECEAAASVLGLPDTTAGTITSPLQAPGCYVSGSESLRFNEQVDSSAAVGSSGEVVCVVCPTTRDTTEVAVTTDSLTTAACEATPASWAGDGYCDDTFNNQACDWDSGDCCRPTCVDSQAYYCGYDSSFNYIGFDCQNPDIMDVSTQCAAIVDVISVIGDGYCDGRDGAYNTAACGWDGGDCCEDTCEDSQAFSCGAIGYRCRDPLSDNHLNCPGIDTQYFGDGFCDQYYFSLNLTLNIAMCDWDGGDCCESTCNAESSTNQCLHLVYDCLDPNATDFGDVSECNVTVPSWLGDGYCDPVSSGYNTAKCGWDGGDCCASTCEEEDNGYSCAHAGYNCLDPNATENTNSNSLVNCSVSTLSWLGDGYCDDGSGDYNTASCGWDGGDCCQETCEDGTYSCGHISNSYVGYPSCADPDITSNCNVSAWSSLGDGWCDEELNVVNCSWDYGDCCANTCRSTSYSCGTNAYSCLDPSQEGLTTQEPSIECLADASSWLGDGYCDDWPYNSLGCNWDDGDCCEDTCVDNSYTCGYVGSYEVGFEDCLDPNACQVDALSWVGDGLCDYTDGYNTASCGWDGGDCCVDTCVDSTDYACGYDIYGDYTGYPYCVDPLYLTTTPRATTDRQATTGRASQTTRARTSRGADRTTDRDVIRSDTTQSGRPVSEDSRTTGRDILRTTTAPASRTSAGRPGSRTTRGGDRTTRGNGRGTTSFAGRDSTTQGYYGFFDGPTTCSSQGGYCVISTKQECQTAASVLGLSDSTAGVVTSPLQAPGCYVSGTDLRFNQQLDSSGAVGSSGAVVCVLCSTTTGSGRDTTSFAGRDSTTDGRRDTTTDGRRDTTTDGRRDTTTDPRRASTTARGSRLLLDTSSFGDLNCDVVDPCPNDALNDIDSDGLCESEDSCPFDTSNDSDGDGTCNDECLSNQCFGQSCDDWVYSHGLTCDLLEDTFGCQCYGCSCEALPCTGGCKVKEWYADNICDDANNNCGCDWDGGDCCGAVNTNNGAKNDFTYCEDCRCLDPASPLEAKDCPGTKTCAVFGWMADYFCDDGNNNCGCAWDGGDCCGAAVDTTHCEDCECLDPDEKSTNGGDAGVPCDGQCGMPFYVGDNFCDDENNVCGCNWDDGDCCGGLNAFMGGKNSYTMCTDCVCLDPTNGASSCASSGPTCAVNGHAGDGVCDDGNNNCGCNWDAGDCCGSGNDYRYCEDCKCLDPDSTSYGCPGSLECGIPGFAGDNICDDTNNNCGCDWDHGDCCGQGNSYLYCQLCVCHES